MYNYKIKEFGNGSIQLSFYYRSVLSKDDIWKRPEVENTVPTEWVVNPFDELEYELPIQQKDVKYLLDVDDIVQDDEKIIHEREEKKKRSEKNSLNRTKKMLYDYGRSNRWDWFLTFTFEEELNFDRYDYSACQKKLSKWFHNVRDRYCPDLKYLAVPERHPTSGAWHFHALVSNCNELTFEKAINNQEYRKDKQGKIKVNKKGQPIRNKYFGQYLRVSYPSGDYIYNIKEYNSGFTTATKITDTYKSVSYIVKYITEDLCLHTKGKKRYINSLNLGTPKNYYGFSDPKEINELLYDIESHFSVRLSMDCIKTFKVNVPNFYNAITVFEFDPSKEGGVFSA